MDSRLVHAVAVGRLGSFSRAAEAVNLTQPAVTKSIADLERQIGYPLFHRTSRGVVPTEEGRLFLERAQRLMTDMSELLSGDHKTDPYAGTLRIGVFPGTIEWVLMRPLEVLLKRYPSIRLDLVTATKEQGVRILERGDVDVAVSVENFFEGRPQFSYERFGTVQPVAFARRGHPVLEQGAAVAAYPLVVPTEVWEEQTLRQFEKNYGADPRAQCHRVANFPLACKVVESTDAIGLGDTAFAETPYFSERFGVLPDFQLPARHVCAGTRAQWTPKPSAKALMATLVQVHGGPDLSLDIDSRVAAHARQ